MSYCYPKSLRVRTRRQYQRIAQQPTRHVGYWVIFEARINKYSFTKLGITASRHFGIAVERNRFKRIVREAFRLCRPELLSGVDINVKPRQTAKKAKTADIITEFLRYLGKKSSSDGSESKQQ